MHPCRRTTIFLLRVFFGDDMGERHRYLVKMRMRFSMRIFQLSSLLLLCAIALVYEDKTSTTATIETGTIWLEASTILKRHNINENRDYPALGFNAGPRPEFSETQFKIEPGVFIWFKRDSNDAVSSIELHFYAADIKSKPSYKAMKCNAIEFHPDHSYTAHFFPPPVARVSKPE